MQNSNEKLKESIVKLKRERNAVILAHNYQQGEVQDIADFVGDSLGLSQNAARTDADVIVFCGDRNTLHISNDCLDHCAPVGATTHGHLDCTRSH